MDTTGLRDYQRLHAAQLHRALVSNKGALDASDTGTGKTFVACWTARQLNVTPLIICPKSVAPSWRRAADAMGITVEVINYEKARGVRRVALSRFVRSDETTGKPFYGPFVVRLSRSDWGHEVECATGTRWQWAGDYELMIFDEVHRCAGMTSLNSKLLIAARRQAEHLLALSATAADDPRQLKALGYALHLFELRGFKWWLLKHGCEPGIWGGFDFGDDPAKQQRAMVAIHKSIFPTRGSRMRREEIPNFPRTQIEVKLIADETGKAANLAEALPETFGLAEGTRIRQALELLRVGALADLAEVYAQTSRVVIFLNYTRSIAELRKRLLKICSTPVPVIDGSNTGGEREEAMMSFQSNCLPFIIVNSQAGGEGIGLHDPTGKVDRTALISPCWSAPIFRQVFGRVHRDAGAFSQQFVCYFADTYEALIADGVNGKLHRMDALNDALLNGVLNP